MLLVNVEMIALGVILYRRLQAWAILVATGGMTLACAGALRQIQARNAEGKVAALFAGLFGVAAGCMLLLMSAVLDAIPAVVNHH